MKLFAKKRFRMFLLVLSVLVFGATLIFNSKTPSSSFENSDFISSKALENQGELETVGHPLSIESMRNREYPGSEIVVEQTLSPGSNYKRYIASYISGGVKNLCLTHCATRRAS